MAASTSILTYVTYASPYLPLPPTVSTAGLSVQADPTQIPPSVKTPVLVFRLRLSNSTTVLGVSETSGPGTSRLAAMLQPDFPLSAVDPYLIDVLWVEQGTPPAGIDWSTALATAPLSAATVSLVGGTINGKNCTVELAYGVSAVQIGAQVTAYAVANGVWKILGQSQATGTQVSFTVSEAAPPYRIDVQAVVPASNATGEGSFAAPFSAGPGTPNLLPQAATAFSKVAYDGQSLVLGWSLDTTSAPPPTSSVIEVSDSGGLLVRGAGGQLSGSLRLPAAVAGSALTVAVSGAKAGLTSSPLSYAVVTATPTVTGATLTSAGDKAGVTASVTGPAGAVLNGWLMEGPSILAGPVVAANGSFAFDYDATDAVGLSVVAQALDAPKIASGPTSAPVPLLATAPTCSQVTISTDPTNNANWQIACAWERLPDPASDVQTYRVRLVSDGGTVLATETVSGTVATLNLAKTDIPAGKAVSLVLDAQGRAAAASPATTLPVFFAAPALTQVTTSTTQVAASWTAPAGVSVPLRYALVIEDAAGRPLATSPVGESTAAALPLAGIATAGATLRARVDVVAGPLRVVSDDSMGAGVVVGVLTDAPVPQPTTCNPVTNVATLHWSAVAGATYALTFGDGTTATAPTNSHLMPSPTQVGSALAFTVRAVTTNGAVQVTGPRSVAQRIPATGAALAALHYDGSQVEVDWAPVAEAAGYIVSVYDDASSGAPVQSTPVSATVARFAFAGDPTKTYTAHVQPVFSSGTGLSTAGRALFPPALFASRQPAASAVPYVYLATRADALGTATANPVGRVITVHLPEIGAAPGALGVAPITVAPFTIAPSSDPALPYELTIANDPMVWGFDTAALRGPLMTAYTGFLTTIENPGNQLAGATPYGIGLVQAAIARIMPQTVNELLYYHYGLTTTARSSAASVDLRPGMVLRAILCDYIDINQTQLPAWVNGYGGASTLDLEIGSYTNGTGWRTGFGGFLSTLAAMGALSVEPPYHNVTTGQAGDASGIDLYFPAFQQPFYRLFIPAAIPSPSAPETNDPTKNFAIVAAGDFAALEASAPDRSTNTVAYFRGRTTLEVLIRVTVNGDEQLVPVGTSVGNLLERSGSRAVARSALLTGTRLHRSLAPAVTDPDPATALGPTLAVRLDWGGFTTFSAGQGLDILSMPVLSGDALTFPTGGS